MVGVDYSAFWHRRRCLGNSRSEIAATAGLLAVCLYSVARLGCRVANLFWGPPERTPWADLSIVPADYRRDHCCCCLRTMRAISFARAAQWQHHALSRVERTSLFRQ